MNIKINYFNKGLSLYLIALITLCFTACKSEDSVHEQQIAKTQVSFVLNGITDATEGPLLSNVQKIASTAKSRTAAPAAKVRESLGNFDWELSAASSNIQHIKKTANVKSSSSALKKVAATRTSMPNGRKYRILFYELSGGQEIYRHTEEVEVSTNPFTISLAANAQYKWYAYSYNDVNAVPLPTDLSDPTIPTRTNAPLLFDQGQFTNDVATERIEIEFEHKISKIEVMVNGTGVFANSISSLQAKYVNVPLTTHNFSIKSGAVVGNSISTVNSNDAITFSNYGTPAAANIKISTNELYTSTALAQVSVQFNELTINKTGVNSQLISSSSPRTATIAGFVNPIGNIRRAHVNLLYKGGVIGDKTWAEGNLYYDSTDPSNPYKFADPVSNGQTAACNHYWNWNTELPRSMTGAALTPVGDPCAKVYPANAWRTPSRADFADLGTAYPNNPENGAVYFNALNGEKVHFHEAGWVIGTNCTVANTNDGIYWSSEQGTATTRGYSLEIDERGGVGAGNEITQYAKTHGLSIRCVRNN